MSSNTETNLVALKTVFVGRSGFRVKTRTIGESVVVDVYEFGKSTSKERAIKQAREAAKLAGSTAKPSLISDFETDKPVHRLDVNGHQLTLPQKVRTSTFLFKA